jgi:hypothetical protein
MALYQLTANPNIILRTTDNANIPTNLGNSDYIAYVAWLAAGNTPDPVPVVVPTLAELTTDIQNGIQVWLDTTAQSRGYDSALTCVSYISSSNTTFANEANSMLHWRDAVWSQCYVLQAEWSANTPDPLPTLDSVIALLPTANSFGWQ